MHGTQMIPDEAVEAAAEALVSSTLGDRPGINWEEFFEAARLALIAAAPYIPQGDVEWAVFRASDGENGSPAENLRYSTKAGAQESIDSRYTMPELWEPRHRIVGAWTR